MINSYRAYGHFGELLQGKVGPNGPVALITLPCTESWVDAEVAKQDKNAKTLDLFPQSKISEFVALLGIVNHEQFSLTASMPAGGGAGVSTASLIAIARMLKPNINPNILAQICIKIEGASDSIMFDQPERILWASRKGEIIERFSHLPSFDVIGGFYGPPKQTDPYDHEFPDISDLIADWRTETNLSRLAALSTESAQRMLAFKNIDNDPIFKIAERIGALGVTIAHTGSARGFIFEKDTVPKQSRNILKKANYDHIVQFSAGGSF